MRIRHKPWAVPELLASGFYLEHPEEFRGKWKQAFPKRQPLHLELGCGKGGFMARLALRNPQVNYLAIDIKSEMLGMAKRKIQTAFEEAGRPVDHVRLFSYDIERLFQVFAPEDQVERIYINFCNPWPKGKHHKHRLTHTRQLMTYRTFLQPGGEIWFKTDDRELFLHSLAYFKEAGFSLRIQTENLNQEDFPDNIPTEHEEMFRQMGKPIHFLIAVCPKLEERKSQE